MRSHIHYCLFIVLIVAGCSKAEIHNPPAPPAPPQNDSDETCYFMCGIGPGAEFEGGKEAWMMFLSTTLTYPEDAVTCDIEGIVRVRFVIEKDGTVTNVEALSGPELLQKEATRVISMSSGSWHPEVFYSHPVRSYKVQPIVFRLAAD